MACQQLNVCMSVIKQRNNGRNCPVNYARIIAHSRRYILQDGSLLSIPVSPRLADVISPRLVSYTD